MFTIGSVLVSQVLVNTQPTVGQVSVGYRSSISRMSNKNVSAVTQLRKHWHISRTFCSKFSYQIGDAAYLQEEHLDTMP